MTVPSKCERATEAEVKALNLARTAFSETNQGKAEETKPDYLAMIIAESCAMAARGTNDARAMRKALG